ncbi:MAG: tripartite tricarboxylate transporter substrate binding protein [Planctomycetota bacterium]|jgi:tripartite-type tricarboxylate transporter receptor subunit TctC
MKRLIFWMILVSLVPSFELLAAPAFPDKPINIYVGFAPGGGTDMTARALGKVAAEIYNKKVVVINKPGASGTLAARELLRNKADGYHLLMAGGSETVSVGNFKKLPYHPIDAFKPVLRISRERCMMCVRKDAPWQTFDDFVKDARAHPGKYTYASAGHGSIYHALMLTVGKKAQIKLKHIAYKGGALAMSALMGGHVDIAVGSPVGVQALIESGSIRALATPSIERAPSFPKVPTLKELGYDVYIENQKGLVVLKGTSTEHVQALHSLFKKVMEHERFITLANKLKVERAYLSSEDFHASLKAMFEQIGQSVGRKK